MRASATLALLLAIQTSATLTYFTTSKSSQCVLDCANENRNFCVSLDFKEGACCRWEDEDCGAYMGYCANTIGNEKRFEGMEQWVCPREDFCGDLVRVVKTEEQTIEVKVDSGFKYHSLCTYRL